MGKLNAALSLTVDLTDLTMIEPSADLTVKFSLNRLLKGQKTWLLLMCWIGLGCLLRLDHLTVKPLWTDEFATLVFSLGNQFDQVPLGQIITPEDLLRPLQPNPQTGIGDVVNLLLDKDNHPPLYFAIAHLWLSWFPPTGNYLNLWASRALPAFFGVLAIPLCYGLGTWLGRSRRSGHLAALMMAVSPYSIFLSQEARHYTFAVIWVLLSLGYFVKSARYLSQNQRLSLPFISSWIVINGIGLSVHFFCGLAFVAEFMALGWLCWQKRKSLKSFYPWLRLVWVILGTITTALIWIMIIHQRGYGNGMTQWIHQDNSHLIGIISPPFQLLAAWITMLCLLPIESANLGIAILSGLGMFLFLLWFVPLAKWSLTKAWHSESFGLETQMLIICFLSLVLLYLGITYFGGMDITRGARYSFPYLPIMVLILTISLTVCWQEKRAEFDLKMLLSQSPKHWLYLSRNNGQIIVLGVALMGIMSCLSITHNLGYRKYYSPEQFLSIIQQKSQVPSLIVTTHQSLVQTGEMMSIAWEMVKSPTNYTNSFLLIPQNQENSSEATQKLQQVSQTISSPMDIWAVNFRAPIILPNCSLDPEKFPYINGYGFQLYHCRDNHSLHP